jgi:hypothetical protein
MELLRRRLEVLEALVTDPDIPDYIAVKGNVQFERGE